MNAAQLDDKDVFFFYKAERAVRYPDRKKRGCVFLMPENKYRTTAKGGQ